MNDLKILVETYVDSYNRMDVEGVVACVTEDVVFENISNAGGAMQLKGVAAFQQVAEASMAAFTYRRQRIRQLIVSGDRAAAEIQFQGVAALDLPNGIKQGQSVDIKGATFFEMSDGKLSRIADYS